MVHSFFHSQNQIKQARADKKESITSRVAFVKKNTNN